MTKAKDKSSTNGGAGKASNPQEAFFTSAAAQEGIRLPLRDARGNKTDHWLHIIGVDSDEFRLLDSSNKRRAVEIGMIADEKERDRAILDMTRDLAASLVKGWSFPQECTHKNVVAFFKEAPQIQRAVDMAAANRSLFCKVASES